MKIDVLLGLQWGDEGKGKIVDVLAPRYNVVTFMKWMFTFSMIAALPFGASDIVSTNYAQFTPRLMLDIGFLVIFATDRKSVV